MRPLREYAILFGVCVAAVRLYWPIFAAFSVVAGLIGFGFGYLVRS